MTDDHTPFAFAVGSSNCGCSWTQDAYGTCTETKCDEHSGRRALVEAALALADEALLCHDMRSHVAKWLEALAAYRAAKEAADD